MCSVKVTYILGIKRVNKLFAEKFLVFKSMK